MKRILAFLSVLLFPVTLFASDYHVKQISPNGRSAHVVFHIPIPVENNNASVPLRTALSQYIGTFVSEVPWITSGEVTQLQIGELYEHAEVVKFLTLDSNAQKQTKIDNKYNDLKTTGLNKIRNILKFWGLDRDVP